MKKTKLNDSQIITILNQSESGTPVPELYQEHSSCYLLRRCMPRKD